MKHLRRVRLAGAAALLAASLATTGGALLATASPASANVTLPPITITVSCASLTGQVATDLSSATGTLSQCQLVPIPFFFNGAVSISPLNLGGSSPGTITWGTIGTHTLSSGINVDAQPFVGDCSAVSLSDIAATITLTITSGLGTGLAGNGVICVDPGTLAFVTAGPVVLSGSITIPLPPI
jgi:hypothetical protein